MATKGQKFRKWSFKEKLRIVRKDTPKQYERFRSEHTRILKRKSQQHKSWGYHRLAAAVRSDSKLTFSDHLALNKEDGIRSKARPYHYRKAGEEHMKFLIQLRLCIQTEICCSFRD